MLTEVAETCHAIGVSFRGAMPSVLLLLVLWGCTGEVEPGPKLPAPTVEAVDPSPEQDGLAAPVVAHCASDDYDRCFDTAMARLRGDDGPTAVAMLGEACDGGHYRACFKLGELIRDGRGGKRATGEGAELIARACRGGHRAACDALGH